MFRQQARFGGLLTQEKNEDCECCRPSTITVAAKDFKCGGIERPGASNGLPQWRTPRLAGFVQDEDVRVVPLACCCALKQVVQHLQK